MGLGVEALEKSGVRKLGAALGALHNQVGRSYKLLFLFG